MEWSASERRIKRLEGDVLIHGYLTARPLSTVGRSVNAAGCESRKGGRRTRPLKYGGERKKRWERMHASSNFVVRHGMNASWALRMPSARGVEE